MEILKYTVRAHPHARALPYGDWSLMRYVRGLEQVVDLF
jgi:hypothetical protein